MNVIIIDAAPAQVVPQVFIPSTAAPPGYGPAYGPGYHGGPGFLLPLLLVGGFLLWRGRAGRRWRRMHRPGVASGPADLRRDAGPREEDWNLRDEGEDVRDLWRRGRERLFGDSAQTVARERYARGEISAEEYETIRRTLSGEDRLPAPPASPATDGDLKL